MFTRYLSAVAVTAVLLSACNGAQSKSPVVTRSEGGSTVSPSGDAAARRNTSLVRFVNAMPGSSDLMMQADGRDLFGGVAYKSVSSYMETGESVARFTLRSGAGADAAELAANTEAMTDGYRYTIIAMANDKGEATMRVLRDELVTDASQARIRLVHATPGLGEIDLAVQGQSSTLFRGVNYATEAGFKDVVPMTGKLEVRRSEGSGNVVRLPELTLMGGKAYTIIIAGAMPNKVAAIVFDDTVTPGARTTTAMSVGN